MIDEQKILFVNKKEISVHDADALHSLNLNRWKGWWCSAGIRSLYIHHDGNIFRGTCEMGGPRGSIYNSGIGKAYKWVQCDKDVCACASDMQTPKVRNQEDIDLVTKKEIKNIDISKLNLVDHVLDPDVVFCGAFKDYKLVIWELGRRCNYDCWYCFPDSHNNFEGHKTLGSLMYALENLNKYWSDGQKMKFVFTGGEPTFNPDFLKFVTHLHDDLNHIAHTTTNGSHTAEYYRKLMQVSDIGFSAHLSYLENPTMYTKFMENLAAADESKRSNETSNFNWLGVRVMLQPGKLDLAKRVYDDCKKVTNMITVDLIHGKNKEILPYSEEEIQWMIYANDNASRG